MKKVFFFAAVLICSVSLMAEQTLVKFNMTEAVKVSEKVYDGTTVAQTTGGAFQIFGNVSEEDEVFVKLETAYFDNANVGGGHIVYLEFALDGQDADKYALEPGYELDSVINGIIKSKTLEVNLGDLNIAIEKMFVEKDASANVLTPASIDENEIIAGDEVSLITTARYDNAAVGIDKTITAYFRLEGAAAGNYDLDCSSSVYSTEGIIAAWVTPKPFEDGSYFHTSDIAGVCPDDIEYAAYQLESGNVTAFSIYYGEDAKNVGFEDVELGLSELEGNIKIVVPADAPCGSYSAEVVLTYQGKDEVVYSTGRLPLNFIVKVAAADIVSIYDDVVGVRDMDCRYVAYQWYKDGAILEGATKAYYQQEGGLEGDYSLKVTTVDGENYLSCETHFGPATNVAADKSFDDTIQIVVITARSGVRYNVLGEIVK